MADEDQEPMELQELEQPEPGADEPSIPEEAASEPGEGDESGETQRAASDLEAVFDVPVMVSAILGKTDMEVSELLHLSKGAVVELDRKIGEAIDIYVNDRLVARGEVVIMEERLGITMTEIIKGHRT